MITIEQLLESVDLDFVPRWVTKDEDGCISIWDDNKPVPDDDVWNCETEVYQWFGVLKLSEFDGKVWTECIYEVPRKTTGKIEYFFNECGDDIVDEKEYQMTGKAIKKLNLLVDAVNELKATFALPTLKSDLTDEDLRKMMCDPKYWRDKDSATVQKVKNGFNKLYSDKN